MHAHDIEGVVEPELVLHANCQCAEDTGDCADRDRPERAHRRAGRSDRHEPGNDAGCGPKTRRMAIADLLSRKPREARGTGRHEGVEEHDRGRVVRRDLGTGIESEPAEPQQCSADHDEREIVRLHWRLRPSDATADDDCQDECRRPGIDVDRGAAGEVDDAELVDPPTVVTIEIEHPVGDREVHDRRPDPREDEPCTELRPVGDRACDETDGDAREHRLERNKGHRRYAGLRVVHHEALKPEVLGHIPEEPGLAVGVAECHRVAVQHPQDADDE